MALGLAPKAVAQVPGTSFHFLISSTKTELTIEKSPDQSINTLLIAISTFIYMYHGEESEDRGIPQGARFDWSEGRIRAQVGEPRRRER